MPALEPAGVAVLGGTLLACSYDPVTGFFRDGGTAHAASNAASIPMGRQGTPQECAELVLFLEGRSDEVRRHVIAEMERASDAWPELSVLAAGGFKGITRLAQTDPAMAFDIAVTRDLNGIRAAIKRAMPDTDISVEGLADGIMLAGSVWDAGVPLENIEALCAAMEQFRLFFR